MYKLNTNACVIQGKFCHEWLINSFKYIEIYLCIKHVLVHDHTHGFKQPQINVDKL